MRTPAGFSGRLPCLGDNITSSANPTMKFTVLSVWLLAIPNIGLSKNSSACRRMRAQWLKRKYRLDMHLIGEAGLARCSARNIAKAWKLELFEQLTMSPRWIARISAGALAKASKRRPASAYRRYRLRPYRDSRLQVGEAIGRPAGCPPYVEIRVRLNPFRALKLRGRNATNHRSVFLEMNGLQLVAVSALHNRANGENEFEHITKLQADMEFVTLHRISQSETERMQPSICPY